MASPMASPLLSNTAAFTAMLEAAETRSEASSRGSAASGRRPRPAPHAAPAAAPAARSAPGADAAAWVRLEDVLRTTAAAEAALRIASTPTEARPASPFERDDLAAEARARTRSAPRHAAALHRVAAAGHCWSRGRCVSRRHPHAQCRSARPPAGPSPPRAEALTRPPPAGAARGSGSRRRRRRGRRFGASAARAPAGRAPRAGGGAPRAAGGAAAAGGGAGAGAAGAAPQRRLAPYRGRRGG